MPPYKKTLYASIVRNSRVCTNCHALLFIQDPLPERYARKYPFLLPERTPTTLAEYDAPPGDTVSEWTPRAHCGECGHFRDPGDRYVLTKREAIRYAVNLSVTVQKLAIEQYERGNLGNAVRWRHDPDTLVDVVRYLKSQPEYQFLDRYFFAVALEIARKRR